MVRFGSRLVSLCKPPSGSAPVCSAAGVGNLNTGPSLEIVRKGFSLLTRPWCQGEPTQEGRVYPDAYHQELDKSDNIEGGIH